jgi:hypothetical protein
VCSKNQACESCQADPYQPGVAAVVEAQSVEFKEGECSGQRHDTGKCEWWEIPYDSIQQWSEDQNGIDPTGVESGRRNRRRFSLLLASGFVFLHGEVEIDHL